VAVRLLVIEDCPNETAVLLHQALDDVGLSRVPIHTEVVTDPQHAEQLGSARRPFWPRAETRSPSRGAPRRWRAGCIAPGPG
jgi:hypothetical protein